LLNIESLFVGSGSILMGVRRFSSLKPTRLFPLPWSAGTEEEEGGGIAVADCSDDVGLFTSPDCAISAAVVVVTDAPDVPASSLELACAALLAFSTRCTKLTGCCAWFKLLRLDGECFKAMGGEETHVMGLRTNSKAHQKNNINFGSKNNIMVGMCDKIYLKNLKLTVKTRE
jgi:hypothetical protein